VELPKAAAQPVDASKQEPLVLSIDREGRLYINIGGAPNRPVSEEIVTARATAALQRMPERQVLVKADERIAYGRVVQAMVILQRAGAKKVGFLTEPPAEPRRTG